MKSISFFSLMLLAPIQPSTAEVIINIDHPPIEYSRISQTPSPSCDNITFGVYFIYHDLPLDTTTKITKEWTGIPEQRQGYCRSDHIWTGIVFTKQAQACPNNMIFNIAEGEAICRNNTERRDDVKLRIQLATSLDEAKSQVKQLQEDVKYLKSCVKAPNTC